MRPDYVSYVIVFSDLCIHPESRPFRGSLYFRWREDVRGGVLKWGQGRRFCNEAVGKWVLVLKEVAW